MKNVLAKFLIFYEADWNCFSLSANLPSTILSAIQLLLLLSCSISLKKNDSIGKILKKLLGDLS